MVGALTDNRTGLALVVIVIALVIMVIVAAVLFFRLLTKFKPVHDQLAPFGAKAAFWGAVAYTLLPIDILPDPFMGDDIGLLALALFYINKVLSAVEEQRDVVPGDDFGEGPTDIIGR